MRVAVLVFDWEWNYIGHKEIEDDETRFPPKGDALAWDSFSLEIARPMIPAHIKDVHTAVAHVDGDKLTEDDVKATVEQIQEHAKKRTISRCETWEYPGVSVTEVTLPVI